jgi:hypothetical protein
MSYLNRDIINGLKNTAVDPNSVSANIANTIVKKNNPSSMANITQVERRQIIEQSTGYSLGMFFLMHKKSIKNRSEFATKTAEGIVKSLKKENYSIIPRPGEIVKYFNIYVDVLYYGADIIRTITIILSVIMLISIILMGYKRYRQPS